MLQDTITRGLEAGIATRDANLADGRDGRLLGGDDQWMWFLDSSLVEGVDYAVFYSEEAARAYGADISTARIGPGSSRGDQFWVFNIGASVSILLGAALCLAFRV